MFTAKQTARFWKRVNKLPHEGDCWEWSGYRLPKGYGGMYLGYDSQRRGPDGRLHADTMYAHRFSYIVHFGEIHDGLKVLHRCDNPPCVRPDHLFLGTNGDNVRDMYSKGRGGYRGLPGEWNHKAKLRERDVYAMRAEYRALVNRLADEYAVTRSLVRQILRGKVWGHLLEAAEQSAATAES